MPSNDPLILFYTSFFGEPVNLAAIPKCAAPVEWTNDRRRISEAAAVVFHLPDFREIGDARKYPGQVWVAWSMESVVNYPRMNDPRVMRRFDMTMTYESGSDVWAPYLPAASWWEAAQRRPIPSKTESAPAVHFQSSTIDRSGRAAFAAELAQAMAIDSYGRHRPTRSLDGPDLGAQTKIETIGRYRFCLALENSIAPDYVTEKIFDPLLAGTVPVYLGAPNVRDFVPAHSYIDATAFGTPAKLASYLQHLVETPQEYEAYFAWRSRPLAEPLAGRLAPLDTPSKCRLAEVVHRRIEQGHGSSSGRPTLPFGPAAFLRTRLYRWRRATGRR